MNHLIRICNLCLREQRTSSSWHKANVVSIFKKGHVSNLNNYRPISLLQVSYKIFAALLLKRLKDGGAEHRIWKTQFGFRSGYGTNDALFYVRRRIEKMFAIKIATIIVVALDWAKTFD